MRRFTEKDIENMLSKTESTLPEFDKKVNFPEKTIAPIRRRRYRTLLTAACIIVLAVSVTAVFMLSKRNSDFDVNITDSSSSQFVSGVSQYPPSESSGFTHESYEFSAISEGEMSIAWGSSDPENNSSVIVDELPTIVYPKDNAFYVGQGLGSAQTADEYFSENPLEHLGSRLKLPVFSRAILSLDERKATIDQFSQALGMNFAFDESMYGITGDCRGLSDDKHFSVNAGEYGDWYFIAYTVDYIPVKSDSSDTDMFVSAVSSFVAENSVLFEKGEYTYTVTTSDTRVYVVLKNTARNGNIAKAMPAYTFSFKKSTSASYSLASIEYNYIGESLGEYETKLYASALNEMFANSFYSEHGFVFDDEDTFQIVGHDVRYLSKNDEALVCPYYAFVVRINPNSEDSYLRTLFVPAIISADSADDSSDVTGEAVTE